MTSSFPLSEFVEKWFFDPARCFELKKARLRALLHLVCKKGPHKKEWASQLQFLYGDIPLEAKDWVKEDGVEILAALLRSNPGHMTPHDAQIKLYYRAWWEVFYQMVALEECGGRASTTEHICTGLTTDGFRIAEERITNIIAAGERRDDNALNILHHLDLQDPVTGFLHKLTRHIKPKQRFLIFSVIKSVGTTDLTGAPDYEHIQSWSVVVL